RRRHTRSKRDWSSDVCSSDLNRPSQALLPAALRARLRHQHTSTQDVCRNDPSWPLRHTQYAALLHCSSAPSFSPKLQDQMVLQACSGEPLPVYQSSEVLTSVYCCRCPERGQYHHRLHDKVLLP